MRDIRIWTVETKRCEAVWLGNLLTLCGCQVWKGNLCKDSLEIMCGKNGNRFPYLDILLFDTIDADFCNTLAAMYSGGGVWISGDGSYLAQPFWWGISAELELNNSTTITEMMRGLCSLIAEDMNETEGVLKLTSEYVASDNALARNIYTINELFCSRHIDYSQYKSRDVLPRIISQVENWYQSQTGSVHKVLTFSETFAFTYVQNMINDAYVKARVSGGFDVRIVLSNANYLLKCDPSSAAVRFLKLRILRNCIHYPESPDEILMWISERSAHEYIGRAYCEMGDIARENPNAIFNHTAAEYFGWADDGNLEEYCGLYKLGYIFEQRGRHNPAWFESAIEMYSKVMDYIKQAIPDKYYSTPQEFEYYYKAYYGLVKVRIERDRMLNNMSDVLRGQYEQELKQLSDKIEDYRGLYFWNKFYGAGEKCEEALSVMGDKMENIVSLIKATNI